jgi:hypothetical protein
MTGGRTRSSSRAGGSDSCSLHTNLRHNIRYGPAEVVRPPLHRADATILSSSGCSWNVRATRGDDAMDLPGSPVCWPSRTASSTGCQFGCNRASRLC